MHGVKEQGDNGAATQEHQIVFEYLQPPPNLYSNSVKSNHLRNHVPRPQFALYKRCLHPTQEATMLKSRFRFHDVLCSVVKSYPSLHITTMSNNGFDLDFRDSTPRHPSPTHPTSAQQLKESTCPKARIQVKQWSNMSNWRCPENIRTRKQ